MAKILLRLPDKMKSEAEANARHLGISTNAYARIALYEKNERLPKKQVKTAKRPA